MPKFITIGYGDEAGYARTPASVRAAAHEQDAWLGAQGALMGIAGTPVQVRNPEATGVKTGEGAFMSAPLPVAGFAVIEAATIEEAIEKVSGVPCAVAHGVVEVWPLVQGDE
ncbi:transcription initiation protein [Oricola indica]|uniref:transcription initiation protein n=1 Tax=Oricola indica TaxID=2872591 RepID=UPI003CCBB15C